MGLLPGLNPSAILLLLYPFLTGLEPIETISFYGALLIMSQYMGSVSAIKLGIPGENTSLPAVKEGFPLNRLGLGNYAVALCAKYSFVGSLIALVLFIMVTFNIDMVLKTYGSSIQFTLICMILIMLCFSCTNRWIVNLALMLFGCFLGKIGYDGDTGRSFLTFDNIYMEIGIPTLSTLVWLFVFPTLYHSVYGKKNDDIIEGITKKIVEKTKFGLLSLRSSLIGFFIGIVPFSYYLSSQAVWAIEKWMQGRKYSTPNIRCLVAAETANNSAAISSLIPLLLIGLPITASEVIVYNIITSSGNILSADFFTNSTNQITLALAFVIANALGLLLAWPLADWITNTLARDNDKAVKFSMIMLLGVYFYQASTMNLEMFYLVWMCVLAPIGFLLRRCDLIPLVIGFFLVDRFEILLQVVTSRLL
jgi:putative tricarboxylic transport membrane protein